MAFRSSSAASPGAAAAEEKLQGTLERVVFTSEESGWSVVRLAVEGEKEAATVVGKLPEVQPGERLELTGGWVNDKRYGRQFQARSCRTVLPTTADAIEKYLGSGLIEGIGKVMAKRLVARFGTETLKVIEKQSARLAEVEGIGPKRIAMIREAWEEQREIKEVMLFLQGHDVATSHAIRIWKTYGPEAIDIVRRDPYRLARDIHGIGFRTADQIAARLGLPPDSPERARAAIGYLLGEASARGHLYLPRTVLVTEAVELLEVDPGIVETAITESAERAEVVLEPLQAGERGAEAEAPDSSRSTGGWGEAVYSLNLHGAEVGLADALGFLLAHPGPPPDIDLPKALAWFEKREGITLAPEQRHAIARALEAPVLVITGGPGTGKTTLVKGIVSILAAKRKTILLAAPTGRAAKRLGEATGEEAKTLHRMLEFNPHLGSFERDEDTPLEGDMLIVDEASMLDVPLAHSVVRALAPGTQLVLVGDIDQLPSVGPGQVLGSLIESGAVDVVRLAAIFRQAEASSIVLNAHRVNRGEMPELGSNKGAGPGNDFFFIPREEPEAILSTLLHVVAERIPSSFGFDPMSEIQVLSPMNRGLLGVNQLNQELRERLNPARPGLPEVVRGGRVLRLGDKVMQVRNNYELEVFNGDLGRISAIDEEEQEVEVRFEGRPVTYTFGDLDELRAAYACSIHKSQGSEYPCIVLPLAGQHYLMLARNLLYTALTRARKLAVLLGERRAVSVAVRTQKTADRYTRLALRLAEHRAR